MKWAAFFTGVAVGLIIYLFRPRYYPAIEIDDLFEVPEDPYLADLVSQITESLNARRNLS